jgi:hypothetical protein
MYTSTANLSGLDLSCRACNQAKPSQFHLLGCDTHVTQLSHMSAVEGIGHPHLKTCARVFDAFDTVHVNTKHRSLQRIIFRYLTAHFEFVTMGSIADPVTKLNELADLVRIARRALIRDGLCRATAWGSLRYWGDLTHIPGGLVYFTMHGFCSLHP